VNIFLLTPSPLGGRGPALCSELSTAQGKGEGEYTIGNVLTEGMGKVLDIYNYTLNAVRYTLDIILQLATRNL